MEEDLKFLIGKILIYLFPNKAVELTEKGITIAFDKNLSKTDRLMRYALLKNAEKNKDYELLAQFHKNFWTNMGQKFFSNDKDTLNNYFLRNNYFLFKELKTRLNAQLNVYDTMVEIGSGQGDVLNYLSAEFTQIKRFVGIDLNSNQSKINTDRYRENKKIEFVAADGFEWIKSNKVDNLVIFTSGGVLEYSTEESLVDFFRHLSTLDNFILIVIEPIGRDVDFKVNPKSQPYGYESSFSHNYSKLFIEAGFKIWHKSKINHTSKIFFTAIGVEKHK